MCNKIAKLDVYFAIVDDPDLEIPTGACRWALWLDAALHEESTRSIAPIDEARRVSPERYYE